MDFTLFVCRDGKARACADGTILTYCGSLTVCTHCGGRLREATRGDREAYRARLIAENEMRNRKEARDA